MTRVVPKLLLAAVLVTLAIPTVASASPSQVKIDCEDGQLDKAYSLKDLRGALDSLASDQDEYTDCRPVINAAIAAAAGKGKGKGDTPSDKGGGGADGTTEPLSGEEQSARQTDAQALAALTSNPDGGPIEVGGEEVKPGENGVFDVASAENGVPTPLAWLLIALAVAALGGLLVLGRRHLPALQRIPASLKRISLPRELPRLRRR